MKPLSENFFKLSSAQFAERDRIEASREVIGRSFMKMKFELKPDVPFNVDMVFRVLPDLVLASGSCSAMDCLRQPAAAAKSSRLPMSSIFASRSARSSH